MGARGGNFRYDVFARMASRHGARRSRTSTWRDARTRRRHPSPLSLVEEVALVGPREKIAEDFAGWESLLVTTLLVSGTADTPRTMAKIVG